MPLTPEQRAIIERNRQAAIKKREDLMWKNFYDRTNIQLNRLRAQKKRKAIIAAKIEANRQAAIKKRRMILAAPRKIEMLNLYLRNARNQRKNWRIEDLYPMMVSPKRIYWNYRYTAGQYRNQARQALYGHKPWSQLKYQERMAYADLTDWQADQIRDRFLVFKRK